MAETPEDSPTQPGEAEQFAQRLADLTEQLRLVLARVERLEAALQAAAPAPAPVVGEPPSVGVPRPPLEPAPPPREPLRTPEEVAAAGLHREPPTVAQPVPPPPFATSGAADAVPPFFRAPTEAQPAPLPPPAATEGATGRLEREIGLKWMGRVGVIALILAAGLFLQYAFQVGWISPPLQFAVAVVTGLVLLVLGARNLALGRRPLGEALLGGGVAVLYAAIYAGYALYHLPWLPHPVALGLMVATTALGVVVAVRADALSTALLAALGGFLTPALMQTPEPGDPVTVMLTLFGYVTVLDLGLLGLSLYRQWRALQFLSFFGTWSLYWSWQATLFEERLAPAAAAVATLLFLIFALVPVVHNLWRRLPSAGADLFLITLNPVAFFLTLLALDDPAHFVHLPLYAVLLAALYLGLAIVARQRSREDRLLRLYWGGLGVVFAIVAVPLQLHGEWAMIGWAAEALVLVWVGWRLPTAEMRQAGLALATLVAAWMVGLYLPALVDRPGLPLFANRLFLSYLGGLAAGGAMLAVYAGPGRRLAEASAARAALTVALSALLLWGLTAELVSHHLPGHVVMLAWAAEALVLVVLGYLVRDGLVRGLGLGLQGMVAVWMLTLQPSWRFPPGEWRPFTSLDFLAFCAGLVGLGVSLALYAGSRRPLAERAVLRPTLVVLISFLVLWGGSWELGRARLGEPWIPLFWAAEALALVVLGYLVRDGLVRGLGLGLQGAVAAWMLALQPLCLHVWSEWQPFTNPSFLVFCAGLAGLGVSLALYACSRRPLAERAALRPVLPVVISLLVLWGVSWEIGRGDLGQHWMLLFWAVEALALVFIGVRWHEFPLRVTGLCLQTLVAVWLLALYSPQPAPGAGFLPAANPLFLCFAGAWLTLALGLATYHRWGQRYEETPALRPAYALALGGLGLWGLTAELLRSFGYWEALGVAPADSLNFAVSALWCVYAALLVGIGMVRRYAPLRLLGLLVFAGAVLKIFLYDLASLTGLWRIFSLACLALILIGVSYLYHLYGERLRSFAVRDEPPT